MRWSDTVDDYYPVNPRPRWGYGLPAHPQIDRVLESGLPRFLETLDQFQSCRPALHRIPLTAEDDLAPCWNNIWFNALDAASLVCFFNLKEPKRYVEIGSGFSTKFARFAINTFGLDTTITSVDPKPRARIDQLCDRVVRQSLEDCPLEVFDDLQAGDILFLDGSHRVFANSDVTVFFFDVLPRLKPGVLIHIHDVFLPCDYPQQWNARLYSEQYILGAMLMCKEPPFKVVFPNFYLFTKEVALIKIKELFSASGGRVSISILSNNKANTPGKSFWIETV